MKTTHIVWLSCLSLLISVAVLSADAGSDAAGAPAAPAAAEAVLEISYIDADIQNVLRSLAAKAGINLILGDEVTGKVTVNLTGVSYEDAMKLIAESKNYAYVKSANVVKIKSKELLEAEPVEVRVHTLNYAKADDIKKTLEPLLTKQGRIQVDTRSNTLVFFDTPSNLIKLISLTQSLDTQTPQVMIEAKFVETSKNPRKDLGINWSGTLLNHQLSARGNQIDPVTGETVPGFSLIKDLAGGPWTPATAILNAGDASVVFSYLNADKDTELLANPRVVTTDNGKARISIARQFPIPQFQFSEQSASLQINGFAYKDIGIILNVTPRINKDEYITLEVMPEASNQDGTTRLQSGGGAGGQGNAVDIPIISTRVAETTVLIKSGHTLAIGGLMQQDVEDSYTKVPLLGDIPGLGAFFRSKSLNKTKRDLLIFLTPKIIFGDKPDTGYEKYYSGLPAQEVYSNDKWMPHDNAKAKPLLKFGM
jgi:type IV pilus assembly protein PilQ